MKLRGEAVIVPPAGSRRRTILRSYSVRAKRGRLARIDLRAHPRGVPVNGYGRVQWIMGARSFASARRRPKTVNRESREHRQRLATSSPSLIADRGFLEHYAGRCRKHVERAVFEANVDAPTQAYEPVSIERPHQVWRGLMLFVEPLR